MCCHVCHVVGRQVLMVGMCCHVCHVVGRHVLMVGMCCHGCHVVGRHALMLGMWCHVVEGSSRFLCRALGSLVADVARMPSLRASHAWLVLKKRWTAMML